MRSISAYWQEPGSKSQYEGHHCAMKNGVEDYQSFSSCLIWIQCGCLGCSFHCDQPALVYISIYISTHVLQIPTTHMWPWDAILRFNRCVTADEPLNTTVTTPLTKAWRHSLPNCWWTPQHNRYSNTANAWGYSIQHR